MNKNTQPLILAIDTSCDDTSAAVMLGNVVLSNVIASQTELHKPYGGVFPTVAKQAHKENIEPVVKTALKRARIALDDINALAVTVGPGLAPALEVGLNYMKNLAAETSKPLIAVNHIEGHMLSVLAERNTLIKKNTGENEFCSKNAKIVKNNIANNNLNKSNSQSQKIESLQIKYPVLSIIASGGHTQFILIREIGKYEVIGSSLDDAAGECLDKIGRMLNLGYPAGPTMEKFARLGNPKAIAFPLPMTTVKNFDMSFSGLKTFARNYIENNYGKTSLNKEQTYDFCASTQYGVFRHIIYKLNKVLEKYPVGEVWLGGGVSANIKLREMIRDTLKNFEGEFANENNLGRLENSKNGADKSKQINNSARDKNIKNKIYFRTPFTNKLCMDNAAMIGLVAGYKFNRNEFVESLNDLERVPRLRIDEKN